MSSADAHETPRPRPGALLARTFCMCWLATGALSAAQAGAQSAPPPERAPDRPERKAGRVDLRPRFQIGQDVRLKLELKDRVTPKPGGGRAPAKTPPKTDPLDLDPASDPTPASSEQEIGLLLRVKSASPEGTTLEIVYESLKIKLEGPMGEVEFDSSRAKTDASDPVAELFRSIVGTTLIAELDKDGKVRSVSGGGAAALGGLGTGLGSDLLKNSFGSIVTAGDAPAWAKVGDKWSTKSTMLSPGGDWSINATNTLRSVQNGRAMIDIQGTVTLAAASSGAGSGASIPDSKYTGRVAWDSERGMIETMETSLRATIRPPAAAGGGETTREVTTRVTRLK